MEYKTAEGRGSSIITEDGAEDSYQMEMLRKNRFPGLLAAQVSVIDGQKEYCYEAAGYVTLEQYLDRKTIDAQMLQGYLESMKELLVFLEEYLLDPDCLCMRTDYIYVREKENTLTFCYGPCTVGQFEKGLIKLWQFFLQKLDYSDRQNVVMAYEIYQNIVREGYASAFTYKKQENAETQEVVFPWEDEAREYEPQEEKEAEREDYWQLKLPENWKLYAVGILLCGVGAAICYWKGSLVITGAVLVALIGILYALIHFGRQNKGIDSVQNTW